ncbi:MAG: hypothetical protein IH830_13800 [Planctomycetes bacterium]|nr:hypothetical protein [Planctomycetota bacterium]
MKNSPTAMFLMWLSMKIAYGFIIQRNCKSPCVKRLDLPMAGRLWPEFGTHAMGCGDEVHTIFKLLTHHDFGLG